MNADKIKRLRHEAEVLRKHAGFRNWATAANLMIEIASELERLGKIEAAAKAFTESTTAIGSCETFDLMKQLLEANPCPK